MTVKHENIFKYLYIFFILSIIITTLILPKETLAAGSCYNWDDPGSLGDTIECIIPNVFHVIKIILVAVTFVLTIWLIYETFTTIGSANSQKLQTLPMKWVYIVVLIFVLAGGGTVVLNMFLELLGFGDTSYWYQLLLDSLSILK